MHMQTMLATRTAVQSGFQINDIGLTVGRANPLMQRTISILTGAILH
jgi:hypothetical protein